MSNMYILSKIFKRYGFLVKDDFPDEDSEVDKGSYERITLKGKEIIKLIPDKGEYIELITLSSKRSEVKVDSIESP